MAVTVTCDLDVSEMSGRKNELADVRLVRQKMARVWHAFPLSARGRERGLKRGIDLKTSLGPNGDKQLANRGERRGDPRKPASILISVVL
jgi:hypothetical protein